MIQTMVPPDIQAADTRSDQIVPWLYREEERLLPPSATAARRLEFTIGRSCARLALTRLGHDPTPILRGVSREPLWPAGIVGSITHCDRMAGAVVGRAASYRSVGIDAEVAESLPSGVFHQIVTEKEAEWVHDTLADLPIIDRLLFSAKESVYKAWYPITRALLGFDDIDLVMNLDAGQFTARVAPAAISTEGAPPDTFCGRFEISSDVIVTTVVVPQTI